MNPYTHLHMCTGKHTHTHTYTHTLQRNQKAYTKERIFEVKKKNEEMSGV
jgi:hypothetical protein